MLGVVDKEGERMSKEIWTKRSLENHGENLQRVVKEGASRDDLHSQRNSQPWKAKKNRESAL